MATKQVPIIVPDDLSEWQMRSPSDMAGFTFLGRLVAMEEGWHGA